MITYFRIFKNISFAVGALLLLNACNKDFPNLLQNFNEAKDSPESRDKVLLVIVDGLSGPAIQELAPTNITQMTRNGLVTYGSLADPTVDFEVTNESVTASILTGVNSNKNKVTGDDIAQVDLATYPTIFTKLKNAATSRTSSLFTSKEAYATALGADAETTVVKDDEGLVAAATAKLATIESDLNVIQLGDVDKAGQASSYEAGEATYADAVKKMDSQVKQLWDAIKSRSSFTNENWMVVVTSGKGGESSDPKTDFTAYGDVKRNTFTLMYSPKFSRKILPRPNSKDVPFSGNATKFTYSGSGKVTGSVQDPSLFNITPGSDWTITFFAKHNEANTTYNYATFLAKRLKGFEGVGWNIFSESGGWGFNSQSNDQTFGNYINDGQWHALTVVIHGSGAQDSIFAYTDGTSNAISGKVSRNALKNAALSNTVPFTYGYTVRDGDNLNMSMCNLQIYNKAFSREEVVKYAGVTQIDESFPFWDNLQAYWPGYDDANTNVLTEKTGRGAGNIKLTGPVSWVSFNDLVPFFQPPLSEAFFRQVPNAVDISFMVYQWMGVTVESSWNLDGKSWSISYTQIRD